MSDAPAKSWRSWSEAILDLRLDTHMTQKIFGDYIGGFTRSQICRFEKGQSEPTLKFWLQVSMLFGVNIHWMLTGEGKCHVQAG
jgi:DNA-binding XRE family transcriptional regulator